jgi:hypothetical protein
MAPLRLSGHTIKIHPMSLHHSSIMEVVLSAGNEERLSCVDAKTERYFMGY